jgi:hypothetical protein
LGICKPPELSKAEADPIKSPHLGRKAAHLARNSSFITTTTRLYLRHSCFLQQILHLAESNVSNCRHLVSLLIDIMALLQTVHLEHLPQSHAIHIALYRDIKNATFLQQQLLAGNTDFEYALIDAGVVSIAAFLLFLTPSISSTFFRVFLYHVISTS